MATEMISETATSGGSRAYIALPHAVGGLSANSESPAWLAVPSRTFAAPLTLKRAAQ